MLTPNTTTTAGQDLQEALPTVRKEHPASETTCRPGLACARNCQSLFDSVRDVGARSSHWLRVDVKRIKDGPESVGDVD